MNIPSDIYWNGSPSEVVPYIEAFKLKEKRETQLMIYQSWLNGFYVNLALASNNAWTKQRPPYPKYPLGLEDEFKQQEAKKQVLMKDNTDDDFILQQYNIMLKWSETVNSRLKNTNDATVE